MQTITITRYAFSELSKEAQERAIEKARESEYQNFPTDMQNEDIKLQFSKIINGDDSYPNDFYIYYSLSHSQGDGVAFSGSLYPHEAKNLTLPANTYRINISHSGRYYHEYSFDIELLDENYDQIDDEGDKVLEQLRDISRQLAKFGYKWEDDYFSNESLKEMLENMGDVFTSTGDFSDPARN